MKIFDCFMYFDEEQVLDLRLNVLYQNVDYFVIVESIYNHKGEKRNLLFNSQKFEKFSDKIIYIVVDDTKEAIKKPHIGGESLVEQHQRNSLMQGIKTASPDDLIVLSDSDEIPDLSKLSLFKNISNYPSFKF